MTAMKSEISEIVSRDAGGYGLDPEGVSLHGLTRFCDLVLAANELLHLVAPCSAEEFARRHLLESLTLLPHLPSGAVISDVGPGGGFPSIPCLLAREDLRAFLIEAKLKKSAYLNETVRELGLAERASVINRQFEEIERPTVTHVVCRALDKFTTKLPRLVKWSGSATLLFFGGPTLAEALQACGQSFSRQLMPHSEQRYLFIIQKGARTK